VLDLLFQNLTIDEIIVRALVILIAMTVHEFAHNYVGYRMGDPTPRDMGRLTLNPFVHINWIGWLMFTFVGFGILGSAPISEHRMRDRRWGFLAAVAAGPISNLLLAVVFAIPLWFNFRWGTPDPRHFIPTIGQFLQAGVQWNLLLFLFNLIPLYPLDGWHIMLKLLPPDLSYNLQRYQQESMYALFGLIILSFIIPSLNILGLIIGPPLSFLYRLLVFRSF
jgi:Zn-dependent protease